MKFFVHNELDSSSSEAQRLLDQGQATPFAVIARQQSAGRGRLGKTWQSPTGGLYLTLAIDRQATPHNETAPWPCLVAIALAEWIQSQFHLRVTIKWPNDVLYAGAKLAGILCESSVQGQSWGALMIGIGLNGLRAPGVAEQNTTSLQQLQVPWSARSVEAWGEDLCFFLYNRLQDAQLMNGYAAFALEPGQLWQITSSKALYSLEGLDAKAQQKLKSLDTGLSETLSSVRHEFQWLYQAEPMAPLLVMDVGNSLCKLAYFAGAHDRETPALVLRFDPFAAEQARQVLEKLLHEHPRLQGWPVFSISVSPQKQQAASELLSRVGLTLVPLPKRPLQVSFQRYALPELGIDRLAMVEAAREALPARHLLIISAGTCMTVEVLHADGHYLGGYIWPGLQMKLDAMHRYTSLLPALQLRKFPVSLFQAEQQLGVNTESAMLLGVVRESVGAITALKEQLYQQWPGSDWTVLLTGGDAPYLEAFFESHHVPSLILQGVRWMSLGGSLHQATQA